jgi:hypothetical protein
MFASGVVRPLVQDYSTSAYELPDFGQFFVARSAREFTNIYPRMREKLPLPGILDYV